VEEEFQDSIVMARLKRAIHVFLLRRIARRDNSVMAGWVYIMTNRPNGTLYVGVTSDLARRAWEHREGVVEGFTKRYGLKRLVFFETHDDIREAIRREKRLKHWPRAWKVNLILVDNPSWQDLYDRLA
jgi:putative endonuclease